ncbi:MAG: hypothetical protein Q7U77_11410 [Sediminibacterium sp.]|uniref:hypothetical protein n=1 Tax=Sediminibacterium sp. TaxID=1917865 RepID=UPI0027158146|nr:hypothetical protein [Sediminibacterium sp.]MDO8997225.1 hypothetical protein [Sediminibacterium sp.]
MWTEKQLQQLKKAGKIRGYSANQHKKERRPGIKMEKRSKEKDWIAWNLKIYCEEKNIELTIEHRFDQERKWRFDWAMKKQMVAVEYEGLNSEKSRHTTKKGFTGDTEKYNRAQALGWKVIRVTALNYKTLLKTLNTIIE